VVEAMSRGLKKPPPEPNIVIGEDIALREGSRAALSYWTRVYGQARQVGEAAIDEILYTYPSAYVENPDDIRRLVRESKGAEEESYLAYAVRIRGMVGRGPDGPEVRRELMVYVSCEDGKPLVACEP